VLGVLGVAVTALWLRRRHVLRDLDSTLAGGSGSDWVAIVSMLASVGSLIVGVLQVRASAPEPTTPAPTTLGTTVAQESTTSSTSTTEAPTTTVSASYECFVAEKTSEVVLKGAIRIAVVTIDFGGDPLRDRVVGSVTEISTGEQLQLDRVDVGYRKVFGRSGST
jgi:hypothetical protein